MTWVDSALIRTALLLAAAALAPAAVMAQRGQDAALVGTVRDGSGAALADASVTAISAQLIGGAQSVLTDAHGTYRFTILPPGMYELIVERSGFRRTVRSKIALPPGFTLTIPFDLELSPVSETAFITGAPPIVDVRASTSTTLIDRQLIEHLPLSRSVSEVVNLAPGVIRDVGFGGSVRSNPLTIDGTSGNEPSWGTPTVTPNLNWFDEVQIVSVGADARFGEYTGARENAITRSGSNRFSGLVDAWTTRPSWTGNNRGSLSPQLAERFRPTQILRRWDSNFQAGGPIARDRVWFFAGGEAYRNTTRPASFSGTPRNANEPTNNAHEPRYIVKGTAAVSPSVRAEGYYIHDGQTIDGANASPLVQPEALTSYERNEHLWNARWLWTGRERTVVEIRHGGHSSFSYQGPPEERREGPPGHVDQLTGVVSQNATSYNEMLSRPIATGANVTYVPAAAGRGSHELRGGFEFEHARLRQANGFIGGQQYYDLDGKPDTRYVGGGSIYRPTFTRTTMFVQDSWTVTSTVTVNAGVRGGIYGGRVPDRGHVFSARSLSPRIGAAWNVGGAQPTVLRVHYGRYHDPMATTFFDFLDPLSQMPFIIEQVTPSGTFAEITRTATTINGSVDPNVKFSFADEYLVEVERQLPARVSATARVIRRDFKDSIGFIDVGSVWQPVDRIDPGPDGIVGSDDDRGPFTVFYDVDPSLARLVQTNPASAYRRYRAVQFIASSRAFHATDFQASYTWSRTTANYNNAFTSNAGSNDLGTNGVFVNPNRALNADGRTPQDFTHELKAVMSSRLPLGLGAGLVYRYQSGRPWARTAAFGPLTQLFAISVEPRAARQMAAVNTIDVRLEKTWRPRDGVATLGVFGDVFNATNRGVALGVTNLSGPNLGLPTQWLDPRTVRAGARVIF